MWGFSGGCRGSDAAPQLGLRRILCGDVPSTAHVAGRKTSTAHGAVCCADGRAPFPRWEQL